MRASIPITFYTKRGCHLCEDVDDMLDILAERHPLAIQHIDITQNVDVYQRYWQRIPVVIVGDTTLEAPIDARTLHDAVLQAAREQASAGTEA
jgi:glutaredoxin